MMQHSDGRLSRHGSGSTQVAATTGHDALIAQALLIVELDRLVRPQLGDISPEMATAIMAVLIDRGVDGFGELSDYFWVYGWNDDPTLRALFELYSGPHPFHNLWHEDPSGKLVLNFSLAPYRQTMN